MTVFLGLRQRPRSNARANIARCRRECFGRQQQVAAASGRDAGVSGGYRRHDTETNAAEPRADPRQAAVQRPPLGLLQGLSDHQAFSAKKAVRHPRWELVLTVTLRCVSTYIPTCRVIMLIVIIGNLTFLEKLGNLIKIANIREFELSYFMAFEIINQATRPEGIAGG